MTTHTPGPWRALPEEVDRPYIRIRGTRLGCRYKIANVLSISYEGVPDREAVETRANARLIAAAPELLKALQNLLAEVTGAIGAPAVACINAEAAIFKATTRTPRKPNGCNLIGP